MRLHQNKNLFQEAVRATADYKGIAQIYIEKDYWVTVALKSIFTHPECGDAIFKGGTALSKCYNIVERFSEDIDLVVVRNTGESDNKMTNKIKAITKAVDLVLPEVKVAGISHKRGRNRKTAHAYSKEFDGEFGQVRDMVIVEASWLGSSEPNNEHSISSYIYEMMIETNQQSIAKEYEMEPFDVRVLDLSRTLCEKIMSLVRFSYDENPIVSLRNKIRHCYDLHLMLLKDEVNTFFESSKFDALLSTVAQDDIASFRVNEEWLRIHPAEASIFKDADNIWKQLRTTYEQEFSALVYGDLPNQEKVYETLLRIHDRLAKLEWNLKNDVSS